MKRLPLRDLHRRHRYRSREFRWQLLRALSHSQRSSLPFRCRLQEVHLRFGLSASVGRLRNRCHLTGRSGSPLRPFALSRISFRELALAGLLPGITKGSW